MHATIRLHQSVTCAPEELGRLGRQIGACLSQSPGFVACILVEAEPDVLATVSIFEDRVSLEEADRLVGALLVASQSVVRAEPPQVITGEIVFQKGM